MLPPQPRGVGCVTLAVHRRNPSSSFPLPLSDTDTAAYEVDANDEAAMAVFVTDERMPPLTRSATPPFARCPQSAAVAESGRVRLT